MNDSRLSDFNDLVTKTGLGNKVYYTDEPWRDLNGNVMTTTDEAGNTVNMLKFNVPRENYQEEHLGMESLKKMFPR